MLIKPHHFIDIIKLYGAGVEHFVPDEPFGHDFYRVANEILANPDAPLQLTICGDDICKPCNRFDGTSCTDALQSVPGFRQKEAYNQLLDSRIIEILGLDVQRSYSARELLAHMQAKDDLIALVWREEEDATTAKRNTLFWQGCQKLLD